MTTEQIIESCISAEEAQKGRGANIIPPPKEEPLWKQYLEKFHDPLIVVLLVVFLFSTGVSIYEYGWCGKSATTLLEPIGVLMALLLATGVGFLFEVKAGREFRVLNRAKDERLVKVYRTDSEDLSTQTGPQLCLVKKQDVCIGDIVRLESGR